MKIKILLPTEVFWQREIVKITAEAENGHFTLLPHHIDFVTALVPGILLVETTENRKEIFAIDQGILIKCGQEVLVSVGNAIKGESLQTLQETVTKQFKIVGEQEQKAKKAVASLEASLIRNFVQFNP